MTGTASLARHMTPAQPPGRLISELKLASLPSTPTWARRHVTQVLKRWNIPSPVREDAALITSELMTNAVQATGAESRRLTYGGMSPVPIVRLRLRLMPASLLIEVWDPHDESPAVLDADPYGESGRGLMIVKALATAWNFYASQGGGKVVWATLHIGDARTACHE